MRFVMRDGYYDGDGDFAPPGSRAWYMEKQRQSTLFHHPDPRDPDYPDDFEEEHENI